jgi:FtsP/CotA-like multicopper oxidase with cupredoxin domain
MCAGVIHISVVGEHAHHAAWVGSAFLVTGLVQVAVGWIVLHRPIRRVQFAVAELNATAASVYVISRMHGLPGLGRELWDTVGIATTAVEVVSAGAVAVLLYDGLSRRTTVGFLCSLLLLPATAWAALPPYGAPAFCKLPNRSLTLYAEELPKGADGKPRLGFGTSPTNAAIPGPLIEMTEGDCLAVTLVNDISADTLRAVRDDGRWPSDLSLPLGVSLHPHGVRYTQFADGTVHTGSFARPRQALTYYWYAAPRIAAGGRVISPGSAGYWWYHDHVVGTDHGTGGLNSGLFGGLIVRRPSDPRPDRTYVVAMGGPAPLINFQSWPQTFACDTNGNTPGPDCLVAREGERVEFLVIGVPGTLAREDMHVFHLHGHTWADNRTGLLPNLDDDVRVVDSRAVGPSESFGFQVAAGDQVGPGDWMLHCHIQEHSDRGMLTFFRVLPSGSATDVSVPAEASQHHVHPGAQRP